MGTRRGVLVAALLGMASLMLPSTRAFACQVEMGTVTVASTFGNPNPTTINFNTTFDVPPAVFLLTTASGGDPCAMRLFDVTTSSFDVACVEPEPNDGPHVAQTVTFVAITPGVCSVEGHDFEVVCPDISALQHGNGVPGTESWDAVTFQTSFAAAPMVLAEIQSDNSGGLTGTPADAACPWLTASAQQLTASGIELALERSEVDDGCEADVAAERVCYLAVENGSITFEADGGDPGDPGDDVTCEFQNSVGSIVGWDDGCTNVSVSAGTSPIITAFKVTHNGGDGGWLRTCGSTPTTISLAVDEDIFNDTERNHIVENVSVMACSSSFEVTATTDATIVDVRGVLDDDGRRHLEWETVQERGTLSFTAFRETEDGAREAMHERPVRAAIDSLRGAVYEIAVPAGFAAGTSIWIREVAIDGVIDHGPFTVDTFTQRDAAAAAQVYVPKFDDELVPPAHAVDGFVQTLVETTGLHRISIDELAAAFAVEASDVEAWIAEGSMCVARDSGARLRQDDDTAVFFADGGTSSIVGGRMHRIEHVAACDSGQPAPPDVSTLPEATLFEVHVHHESDAIPVTSARPRTNDANEDDFWYWTAFFASGDPEDDVVIDIPSPVQDADSTVTVQPLLRGVSDATHEVEVWVGSTLLGTLTGQGFDELWGTFDVEPENLVGQSIRFVAIANATNTAMSVGFIDSIDWRFASATAPSNSDADAVTTFSPTVDGALALPDPETVLTDVTDDPAIQDAVVHEGARLAALSTQRRYRLDTIASADTPTLATPPGGPSNVDAEYVLIAPTVWRDALERLMTYRASQGLSVAFASLETIFEAHAQGDRDPRAIGRFLRDRWEQSSVRPRYVVIVGSGHMDHHGRMGLGKPIVPPILFGNQDGIFASDSSWGDVVGADSLPDVAVGRLPVRDRAELDAVLDKLIDYDEDAIANQGVVLVSDDGDRAGDFVEQNMRIQALLEEGGAAAHLSLESQTLEEARDGLLAQWSTQPALINYVGHGGLDRFANEGLLQTEHVAELPQVDRPPFVAALSCWINRFEIPGFVGLGQALSTAERSGAVGVWSSGAMSTDARAHLLNRHFLQASATNPRVGDAIIEAYRRYAQVEHDLGMLSTYHLLGDPATKLSLPVREPPPDNGPPSPSPLDVPAANVPAPSAPGGCTVRHGHGGAPFLAVTSLLLFARRRHVRA